MASKRILLTLGRTEFLSKKHITTLTSKQDEIQKFQYTLDNSKLTQDQRNYYEKNGYLVVKNLIKHEYLDRWRERFMDVIEGRVYIQNLNIMKDISLKNRTDIPAERVVSKIQDFMYDEVLSEHCRLPELLDYVECFTGPNIIAINTMLINKPPDAGTRSSRHPLHQDLHYFPFRPSNRIVGTWTSMEETHRDNGCLFVIPGSHNGKLEQHEYPDNKKSVNELFHTIKAFEDLPKKHLEMEKGDTVFFHPLLCHGSGENFTNHCRKAISSHYVASECYLIDVKGTIQEQVMKEIEEMQKRKGLKRNFLEFWKSKMLLVRGRKITL